MIMMTKRVIRKMMTKLMKQMMNQRFVYCKINYGSAGRCSTDSDPLKRHPLLIPL